MWAGSGSGAACVLAARRSSASARRALAVVLKSDCERIQLTDCWSGGLGEENLASAHVADPSFYDD